MSTLSFLKREGVQVFRELVRLNPREDDKGEVVEESIACLTQPDAWVAIV